MTDITSLNKEDKREERDIKLKVRELCKNYTTYTGEKVEAMKGLNLDVYNGEFLVVLGPSGCGKSTFLRMVAGLDNPSSGELIMDGNPITEPGPERGMVFQKYTSFPWLTVADNVAFPLHIQGRLMPYLISRNKLFYLLFNLLVPGFKEREAFIKNKVMEHLKDVGLEKFANVNPSSLSGGMQQRVAIARTLANSPTILLMDEPFGALDAQTRVQMQELLLTIWDKTKCTVIFITHEIEEAIYIADRIAIFSSRPTSVKEIIKVPFSRPRKQEIKLSEEFSKIEMDIIKSIREEYRKM